MSREEKIKAVQEKFAEYCQLDHVDAEKIVKAYEWNEPCKTCKGKPCSRDVGQGVIAHIRIEPWLGDTKTVVARYGKCGVYAH